MAEPEEQQEPAPDASGSVPDAGGGTPPEPRDGATDQVDRGKTVHGAAANAGHRVLAPDDAEVEAYLEVALDAPAPSRTPADLPPVAATVPEPGVVAVLDFGSQFSQLIARRVRELNVYSELLPHDTPLADLERRGVRAIILSGGPMSVYDDGAPKADASIWSGRLPVLGICYGAQLMALELGGDVLPATRREYGPANIQVTREQGLFAGIDRDQPVWMSHGDSITRLPEGFEATAQTEFDPVRGARGAHAPAVWNPVSPRGRPHAARSGDSAQLRDRDRRHRTCLDAGQLRGNDRDRDPRSGRRTRPPDEVRRQGDLRPLGRR